jgi:PEP-CTERM motif
MKLIHVFAALCVLAVTSAAAMADVVSYTGTLATPESTFDVTLDLTSASSVALQTYGFGGGTNGDGTLIAPGGTDPFLAIFSGTGSAATMLTDALANPFGTSTDLTNYASFAGCPPAGIVNVGGQATCGDIAMNLGVLAAGMYTIVLSDGQYVANAVFDNGTLGEGFADLTSGGFCNLSINGANCPNTSGAYALDVTTTPLATPEPGTLLLFGVGLSALSLRKRKVT